MKRIESKTKHLPYSQESVFAKVSDLSNLEELSRRLPQDNEAGVSIKNMSCTPDSFDCELQPLGHVSMVVVSREPFKCVKMETVKSPVKMTIWVQIVPTGENSCKVRLTLDADVNPFIAKMVEKPLAQGVETLADMLTMISY